MKKSRGLRKQAGKLEELSALAGARRRSVPKSIKPQLATSADAVPDGDDWLHEIKYDGYRLLCQIHQGEVRLLTRGGNNWSHHFPAIAEVCTHLGVDQTLLDGEVVAVQDDGTPDFQALQNALRRGSDATLVYYVFDLPYCQGFDLCSVPLWQRKEQLSALLAQLGPTSVVRYSDHIVGHGPDVFAQASQRGLEGIIAKKCNSPYEPRRTLTWLKIKCLHRQELVVGGWTRPKGTRNGLGALLLGYYRGSRLIYCGKVGTGFNAQSLEELQRELERLAMNACPFAVPPPRREAVGTSWVQPQLVAEIEFTEWTKDGRLRHPSFKGLRRDRAARHVVREV